MEADSNHCISSLPYLLANDVLIQVVLWRKAHCIIKVTLFSLLGRRCRDGGSRLRLVVGLILDDLKRSICFIDYLTSLLNGGLAGIFFVFLRRFLGRMGLLYKDGSLLWHWSFALTRFWVGVHILSWKLSGQILSWALSFALSTINQNWVFLGYH